MGFPVVYALFGDEGLILAVLINIPFNFLLYTRGRLDGMQGRTWGKGEIFPALRAHLPPECGDLLGLIFYFGQLSLPEAVFTPIQHLSNVTTPLSMLVTGMNLAQGKVSDVIRDRDAVTSSLSRLLIFPVISWAVMRLVPGLDPPAAGGHPGHHGHARPRRHPHHRGAVQRQCSTGGPGGLSLQPAVHRHPAPGVPAAVTQRRCILLFGTQ